MSEETVALPQRPRRPAREKACVSQPLPEPVWAATGIDVDDDSAPVELLNELVDGETARKRLREEDGAARACVETCDTGSVVAKAVWSEEGPVKFECMFPVRSKFRFIPTAGRSCDIQ